jgi:SAM-dependent methyltransferase
VIFEYRGQRYPAYLKHGNACRFIAPTALEFCKGIGLDIGAGAWPLPGAVPIELREGGDAMALPVGPWDYLFSSHCLEHLPNPIAALEHWRSNLRPGAPLFLYLPHPAMEYWLPQNCRKHLHSWAPAEMAQILTDLGFESVIHGERDLAWGFACVGFAPTPADLQAPPPLALVQS